MSDKKTFSDYEEMFNGYYYVYKQLSRCELEPSPYETIGDYYRMIYNQLI